MRKLVIAVIIFSFLGYGPLKDYFHEHHLDAKSFSQIFSHSNQLIKENQEIKTIITESKKLITGVFKTLETELNQKDSN